MNAPTHAEIETGIIEAEQLELSLKQMADTEKDKGRANILEQLAKQAREIRTALRDPSL